MDIRISKLGTMRVACMEHIGPYNEIGGVFSWLWNYAKQRSLPVDIEKWLGIYWDDPSEVPADKLRSEACVTIGTDVEMSDEEGVTIRTLEGGNYVIGTHVGSYSGLGASWEEIWGNVMEKGQKHRNSPCFELHIKGGDDALPESEWVTELCIPVE